MDVVIEHTHTSGLYARPALVIHMGEASGEIAPLPGHSRESLAEAEAQLRKHLEHPLPSLFPSVQFGFSSALMDLKEPLPAVNCPSHAFFTGSPKAIMSRAEVMHERGFRIAKLKLSDKSESEAHALIHALKERFFLRLDFNRTLSLQQALDFFSRYDKETFDYIEEPLKNVQELVHFPLPFALDETLREPFDTSLLSKCAALVLKPTLLGNIEPFLRLHRRCVLSPCFEGPVGIGQIAKLAARYQLLNETHGLDTLSS